MSGTGDCEVIEARLGPAEGPQGPIPSHTFALVSKCNTNAWICAESPVWIGTVDWA